MSDNKISREVIEEIVEVAKRMDFLGMMNTYEGNISVKKDGLLYVTPTSKSKAKLTPEMVAVLNEDGEQIAGDCKPTSEYPMHKNVYTMREDIGAVIHCHSPYLTAYAICNKPLISDCYPEAIMLLKDVPVAPYGKPGTDEIYAGVRELIQTRNVVLLANHGVLSVGPTLLTACNRMESAEAIAKVLSIAEQIGTPQPLPAEEIERLRK